MSNDLWQEVFKLVEEFDARRPTPLIENRLYYNDNGSIIGLWETSHPEGTNYIVLDDTSIFFHTNTHLLCVKNKKLEILDPRQPKKVRLIKSNTGFKTIKGHAALLIGSNENYELIEYYDRTDN